MRFLFVSQTSVGTPSKSFSNTVEILGSSCGCGNDEGSPHTPSWNPRYFPEIGNDSFVGNKCIGIPTQVKNCTDSKTHAMIRNNIYYLPAQSHWDHSCLPTTVSDRGRKQDHAFPHRLVYHQYGRSGTAHGSVGCSLNEDHILLFAISCIRRLTQEFQYP